MATVDNRIVHMTFDNKQFEQNIAQTIASMDALKKSLDFSAATKGFGDIQRATSGFHLGGIASAVDHIAGKFTALGATAFSVINNIASRAVTAGLNMAKSFTVAPITDGFREMETNMNSIQTILANTSSKGSTLDDVNASLNQLNEYSDQTIYNFSQMARNIGTFTAAGVDLDTSVGAIKGIANVAAISGSNAEQASNAMYQLSQALASGSVKLMDWNSIVNAGMGGEVFQKALFETGKSLGTLQDVPLEQTFDDWKKAGNTFRTSLEDGWLTADVLTNTLNAFTGDMDAAQLKQLGYTEEQAAEMQKLGQLGKAAATEVKTLTQLMGTVKESVGSGWSKTFQIVFGDFEEAKSLFTGLSNAIGGFVSASADRRNDLLQGWKDLGGRTKLLEGLKDAFKALESVFNAVRTAFQRVFPPTTSKQLFALTEAFAQFTKNLQPAPGTLDKLRTVFAGVFSAVRIVIEVVRGVAGVFATLFDALTPDDAGSGLLNFFVDIAEKIINLKKVLVDEQGIITFFETIEHHIRNPREAIEDFVEFVTTAFQELKNIFLKGDFSGIGPWAEDSPFIDKLFDFREIFTGGFDEIEENIKGFFSGLGGLFDVDLKIPDGITEFFKSFGNNVDENTTNSLAGGFSRLSSVLGFFWDILKKVWDVIEEIPGAIISVIEAFGDLFTFVGDAGSALFDFLKNIGPNLQKAFESDEFDKILDFMTSLGVLLGGAGIANVSKNGLKIDVTGGALSQLGELFKQMGGKNGLISQISGSFDQLTDTMKAMETQIKADALMKIAIAIGVLTASVLVLSMIEPEALAKAMAALSVGFAQLIGSMALLNKMGEGPKGAANLATISAALIAMASAALILSGAVANLARLDVDELTRGITAMITILGALVGVAVLLEKYGGSFIGASVGMIGVGIALNLLAGAVLIFATMSWQELGKGFAAVATGLGLIAGAMHLMPASMVLLGPSLVAIAFSLNLLATSLILIASMSWEEIGKGLVGIGVGLGLIAAAMHLMPATAFVQGPALLAISTSLVILGGALKIFASMSWKEIGKAMTVLGGSLVILGLGLTLMSGTLAGSVAVGVAAVSMLLLGKALKEFAKMSWKELGRGLGVMAAALGALGLAALALSATGAIGAILLLGVALVALGAGFALIGLGASLLAEAFQIIAAAGTAGIDVLMYAIEQFIILLPQMMTQFVEGILAGADLLLTHLPGIVGKIGDTLIVLVDKLIELVPKFVELANAYIGAFIKVISENSPKIIALGLQMILDLLSGVRDNIQELVSLGVEIIANFIKGIADSVPEYIGAIIDLITTFVEEIGRGADDIVAAGTAVLVEFISGISDNLDLIVDAVGDLIEEFIRAVADEYDDIIDAGFDIVEEFIRGIGEDAQRITDAAIETTETFLSGLVDSTIQFANYMGDLLIELLDGLAEAIETHDDEIGRSARRLVRAIVGGMIEFVGSDEIIDALWDMGKDMAGGLIGGFMNKLKINSPSKVFMDLAKGIPEGIVLGLDGDKTSQNSAIDLAERTTSSFQKALAQATFDMQSSSDFNPTITPVLDLTEVQTQAGLLQGILASQPLTTQASLVAANTLSAETLQNERDSTTEQEPTGPRVLQIEQNNYSPEALNTAKIYRQTRNLIVLTKEELNVA